MNYSKIVVILNKGEHKLEMFVGHLEWAQQCRKVDSLRKQIPVLKQCRKMGGQPTWAKRGPNIRSGHREWNFDNRIDLI